MSEAELQRLEAKAETSTDADLKALTREARRLRVTLADISNITSVPAVLSTIREALGG